MQEIYRTQGERGGREYRRYIEDSGREGTGRMEVHETGREEEVCRRQRERERENSTSNSNSKTLFYKDCSLGSFKNLSNN